MLEQILRDIRLAVRQLRRSPAFTVVALTTLALGIGANAAIFALVDATLLRPLPFRDPDRLVMMWETSARSNRDGVSPPDLIEWRERSRTLDAIGGFIPNVGGMVMAGADGFAETVPRQWVEAGFFDALGIEALVGRTFTQEDNARRAQVAVLSEEFWRARFNADRSIVGRDIRFDGMMFTIVGVAPRGFQLLGRTSMWALVPIANQPQARSAFIFQVIGRLKPGVPIQQAQAELSTIAQGIAQQNPATHTSRNVLLAPLRDALVGSDLRTTAILFLAVVGIVLLICCVNVANLLLARASTRSRELGMRWVLGAGHGRIVQQLLTESLLLSSIGAVLGGGVGWAILRAAPIVVPDGLLPSTVTLAFDVRVIAFCAAAALVVGIVFGLAPAWQAGRLSSSAMAGDGSRSVTSSHGRLRNLLVCAEVTIAVPLLIGAGLLLRTLLAVERVDRGYGTREALTMLVDPLGSKYPTRASLLQFLDSVEQEIRALPGVRDVAWTSALPLGASGSDERAFEVEGAPPVDRGVRPITDYQFVSPAFFATLDIPMVAGRAFTDRDRADGVPVAIVSDTFVKRHLNGRSPIGVRTSLRPPDRPDAKPILVEIVGVARQVRGRPNDVDDRVQLYVPLAQDASDDLFLVVTPRSGPASALTSAVRHAIGRVDAEQLVSVRDIQTLEDIDWLATSRQRFRAVLVTTFAALALLLAMVGVFGILAYTVQQRVREFGVRRALGATTGDVIAAVVGSAARVIGVGIVSGLMLAAWLGRLIATMLFGVRPIDLTTFAVVTVVVTAGGLMSAAWPTWRAARIEPAAALRMD
jgi:putative ABC transport system permease protein